MGWEAGCEGHPGVLGGMVQIVCVLIVVLAAGPHVGVKTQSTVHTHKGSTLLCVNYISTNQMNKELLRLESTPEDLNETIRAYTRTGFKSSPAI